ncbi:hypothetical protein N7478_007658 [Penicillium angulare]|uniref:uncharacterized protein n=1 Tax=Penicillium angulare TaxID=116970 RepID=UPI002540F090|nr:uncharacterized protein N7478_007658 [Penicillium angulare]KAJ5272533.1 hypothetical protein N7478_007658 [Penicillium angulare]
MLLEFGLINSSLITTGTLGEISLAGELAVGSKKAGVAMKLSQNPKEQLLAAQITDLGVVDLVQSASMIANERFPELEDFLHFKNAGLYLSTGTSIGATEYPTGASLKGDMTISGKRAQFNCSVGSKVQLQASIEQFQLGPELRLKRHGDFCLKDYKSWTNADFEIHGLMEQHLIDHVVGQLEQQLQAAQNAAKHSFDEMKNDMDAKEAAFKEHSKVDEAERAFKDLITEKAAELERVRADATAAIQQADYDIGDAQRDSDNAVLEAQSDLQQVRREFEQGFGGAERDLEGARHEVENAQRHVDDHDRDIDHINRRIDDGPWYNCPPLLGEKAGLLAAQAAATSSLQVVRGIFFAAEGIVHGTGFVAAEGAIGAAEVALDGVQKVKTEALIVARAGLDRVRDAQNAIIQTAVGGLPAVVTASDEFHVFYVARSALEGVESLAQGAISGAQEAVDGLSQCGEFIAFDAAETALRFAQNNTSELNLARHALELAEGAVNLGLDLGQWAVHHAGQIFNIIKVEFSGSGQSLIHASAGTAPLRVTI